MITQKEFIEKYKLKKKVIIIKRMDGYVFYI